MLKSNNINFLLFYPRSSTVFTLLRVKIPYKARTNLGNPRGNPCNDVTSRPHVLRDAAFLQYVYKIK